MFHAATCPYPAASIQTEALAELEISTHKQKLGDESMTEVNASMHRGVSVPKGLFATGENVMV
ncbi:hypothetical protein G6L63_05035 [Agrobacterium vitis]|uniref:hypothetical protein n=1 Tax=Agrobacterium vitis TaxID=373 RepID=UPI0011C03626|nr:hypothetical protein [Agrobacterium vitis]KAA3519649.1 hypothetical protein DXM22_01775 [Agrobacterium vitis]MCF1475795.1 hypothetical protein [Agrobacterium vitis]MUZ99985.1 hypothetical protein [Agrobacterium vitis]MVA29436.1 hypothetical protein [Agrobacterium vitis]NOJ34842.1 hypothetical protein [Agrobacterium vitis]